MRRGADLTPRTLGELFSGTMSVLGESLLPSILIVLMTVVPPGFLLLAAVDNFYTTLGEILGSVLLNPLAAQESLGNLGGAFFFMAVAGILTSVGVVVARIGVTTLTCASVLGIPMTWQKAIRRAAGVRFARALGQVILESLAVGGIIFLGYLLLIILGGFGFFLVFGFLGFLAALGMALWFGIRWSQTYPVITCEDVTTMESFGRSAELVDGQWMRVFGILLLFAVVKEVVIAIVTTPLAALAMWDLFEAYQDMLASPAGRQPDLSQLTAVVSGMGTGVGIAIVLNLIGSTLLVPAYGASLYVDLRSRAGEFGSTSVEEVPAVITEQGGTDLFGAASPWGEGIPPAT
jgi:hypothetical protein